MKDDRQKLTPMLLVCLYPLVSTFLMTMVWQITQHYYKPFLGGYYFKWMHLYTVDNSNWLQGELKAQSQVLFSIYLAAYLLLFAFVLISVFFLRLRAYMAWGMGLVWIADGGWIVWDMIHKSNVCWQYIFNLTEHVLFLGAVVVFSVRYLKLRKNNPELFAKKVKKEKKYTKIYKV